METTSLNSSHTLYPYQERDIQAIFHLMETTPDTLKLIYQLPTGGGKTIVFSEIARRFIERTGQQAVILTHRQELCRQTSMTLKKLGISNKTINSKNSSIRPDCNCYVAMVETLRNRIKAKKVKTNGIGLVIIDEAHHNSFRKLLKHFKGALVIGVTATPFSADISKPMKRHYNSLIIGEDIQSLISQGFLAIPKSTAYEVELNSLRTGIHGDYTVSSSNELYSSHAMLNLLLKAYNENCKGRKTLIFNNGIETSVKVYEFFKEQNIPIRHLDNRTSEEERKDILLWFKKTKGAVLTSVSILTTGFDEPTVEAVILNRATTSITLYHQMIGRGSRRLPNKKTFSIIDLGNNIQRFGEWQEPVDWKYAFENPDAFSQQLNLGSGAYSPVQSHAISAELRSKFPNTLEMAFDIEAHYTEALENDKKPKTVIQQSIRQQTVMCLENSETLSQALDLAKALHPEIEWRVKQYVKCLGNASKSYKEWLMDDYQGRLEGMIKKLYNLKKDKVA